MARTGVRGHDGESRRPPRRWPPDHRAHRGSPRPESLCRRRGPGDESDCVSRSGRWTLPRDGRRAVRSRLGGDRPRRAPRAASAGCDAASGRAGGRTGRSESGRKSTRTGRDAVSPKTLGGCRTVVRRSGRARSGGSARVAVARGITLPRGRPRRSACGVEPPRRTARRSCAYRRPQPSGIIVITDLLNLPPASLLTDDGLRRAARRVAALPSVQISRVSYSPRESGTASIDVAVVERPLLPNTWPSLVAASITAATAREARIDVASPSGQGERWTLSGRWWAGRPRVSARVATPQLWRGTGLWRVEGTWERQTYRLVPSDTARDRDAARFESDRRRASVTFADWWSGDLRWEVGGSLDQWRDRGQQVSVGASVERRLFADRVAARADGAVWPRVNGAPPFATSAIAWAWRSTAGDVWPSWTGVAAVRARDRRRAFRYVAGWRHGSRARVAAARASAAGGWRHSRVRSRPSADPRHGRISEACHDAGARAAWSRCGCRQGGADARRD